MKTPIYALVGIVIISIIAVAVIIQYSPSTPSQTETTVLYLGTTNLVKVDNYMKDYYMGTFAGNLAQDPLAVYDSAGKLTPYLVNWSTSDAITWDIQLIRNATWHDGVPVTAEDIAFTIMYLKEKNPNYTTHFQYVESAVATDALNVRVTLSRPYTSFANSFAATDAMPKHVWYNVTDPMTYDGADKNIGSGPFVYEGFDSAAGVMTFTAYENYWRGPPSVDKVVIKFYTSTDSMIMALKKGEIAATYAYAAGIDPSYVPTLLESENVSMMILPNFGVDNTLWFNCQRYPYNISAFRNALSYALDYDDYKISIAAGYASTPTSSWIPSSWDYYSPHSGLVRNITYAASLLDNLNFKDYDGDGWRDYPNGTAFVMQIVARSDLSVAVRLAELVKGDLADVGVRAQIVTMDLSSFQTTIQGTKNFESTISRTTFWGMVMYAGGGTLYFDARNMGWANVNDPRYLDLVDELLSTSNSTHTKELYYQLQDLYSSEMYGIPLYWGKIIQPYRSDLVSNLVYDTMNGIIGKETWFSLTVKG